MKTVRYNCVCVEVWVLVQTELRYCAQTHTLLIRTKYCEIATTTTIKLFQWMCVNNRSVTEWIVNQIELH